MLSGTSGECLLAWCILFISAEAWNAKYVAALLPVTSSMASFWQTSPPLAPRLSNSGAIPPFPTLGLHGLF